jgi:hypothetical protein
MATPKECIKYKNFEIVLEALEKDIAENDAQLLIFDDQIFVYNQTMRISISSSSSGKDLYQIKLLDYFYNSDSFLLHRHFFTTDDMLIVYYGFHLVAFQLPTLSVKWGIHDFNCVINIYFYKNDFIIYDEISVARITKAGEIIWRFSGLDHFVSYEGENTFELKKDHIALLDSAGNRYKIDYDGNDLTRTDKIITSNNNTSTNWFQSVFVAIKNTFNLR